MKQRTGGPRGAAGVEALVQLLRYASTLIAQDQEERICAQSGAELDQRQQPPVEGPPVAALVRGHEMIADELLLEGLSTTRFERATLTLLAPS